MYYYDIRNNTFLVNGIHEIPADAISVSENEFKFLVAGRAKGKEIVLMNNSLTLTPPKPSPYHNWNGTEWEVSNEKLAEIKAIKLQQFITAIDDKAASIYGIWTRFEQEYTSRENAAKAFKGANYEGEVSRFIADFAEKAGIDNKTAADLILVQAEGLRKLLVELANQRMRKYELQRDGLSLEEMQAIYNDIIQQMEKLAEAYQNG